MPIVLGGNPILGQLGGLGQALGGLVDVAQVQAQARLQGQQQAEQQRTQYQQRLGLLQQQQSFQAEQAQLDREMRQQQFQAVQENTMLREGYRRAPTDDQLRQINQISAERLRLRSEASQGLYDQQDIDPLIDQLDQAEIDITSNPAGWKKLTQEDTFPQGTGYGQTFTAEQAGLPPMKDIFGRDVPLVREKDTGNPIPNHTWASMYGNELTYHMNAAKLQAEQQKQQAPDSGGVQKLAQEFLRQTKTTMTAGGPKESPLYTPQEAARKALDLQDAIDSEVKARQLGRSVNTPQGQMPSQEAQEQISQNVMELTEAAIRERNPVRRLRINRALGAWRAVQQASDPEVPDAQRRAAFKYAQQARAAGLLRHDDRFRPDVLTDINFNSPTGE